MAKRAFDHCSDDYARYRPSYPAEVIARVARDAPPGIIADVGAGTGIFTHALAGAGREVVAIEPSVAMLGQFAPACGTGRIHCVCASAERTAIATASMSAVTCAQSFHWFNPPVALAEFARILQPGGLLLLVWNNRDGDDAFVAAFEELVATWNPAYRREYRAQDWAAKVAAARAFSALASATVRSTWRLTADGFIGFTRSVSYIRNVLAREDAPRFERALRDLLAVHFPDGKCEVPLTTTTYWCHKLG
ncbi:MAG: class I SAM-dependent methyltransferase [Phycisphaerales bacterium]|nr:class I SAM-dependent methyltransferase [Phycisphaerales bacterium]